MIEFYFSLLSTDLETYQIRYNSDVINETAMWLMKQPTDYNINQLLQQLQRYNNSKITTLPQLQQVQLQQVQLQQLQCHNYNCCKEVLIQCIDKQ